MTVHFRNPSNGYIEKATGEFWWLWAFLFGAFYFAYKGLWDHAVLYVIAALVTLGLSMLIYPFFAAKLVRKRYGELSWIETSSPTDVHRNAERRSVSAAAWLIVPLMAFVTLVVLSAGRTRPQPQSIVPAKIIPQPPVSAAVRSATTSKLVANRHTLACRSLRSAESFAVLDALGASQGLLSPQSDASKTDCVHVRKNTPIERNDIIFSSGVVMVWIGKSQPLYMLDSDLVP